MQNKRWEMCYLIRHDREQRALRGLLDDLKDAIEKACAMTGYKTRQMLHRIIESLLDKQALAKLISQHVISFESGPLFDTKWLCDEIRLEGKFIRKASRCDSFF